jgi:anaerobic sulfite reductase subunit B
MPRTKILQKPKEEIANPYLPKAAKMLEMRRQTKDAVLIKTDFKADHRPGQFVEISMPGIGEVPMSIASYSPDYMEFSIREVGSVTRALGKLKKGDTILMRGPYGNGYPMENFAGKGLVLIGGGNGVAPLKGILAYIDKNKEHFPDVQLYFGFNTPEDILFKEEFKSWRKKYHVYLSVDSNPTKAKIQADTCFISKLVEKSKISPENKIAFICGPPAMIAVTIDLLKEKGFTERQIYLSTERLMECGLGICGHCMFHGKYTCLDGPVFRCDEISQYKND